MRNEENIGHIIRGKRNNYFTANVQKQNYLSRPHPFKFLKICLSQILLDPLLNTLSHLPREATKDKKELQNK